MKVFKKIIAAGLVLTMAFGCTALAYDSKIENKVISTNTAEVITVEKVIVDGTEAELGVINAYKNGENIMLPIRQVAEGLGFTVEWNQDEKSADIDNKTVKTKVYIGSDSYYMASSKAIGMSKPSPLGAAPELIEGRTYIPMALFNILYGDGSMTIKDGVITVTTK